MIQGGCRLGMLTCTLSCLVAFSLELVCGSASRGCSGNCTSHRIQKLCWRTTPKTKCVGGGQRVRGCEALSSCCATASWIPVSYYPTNADDWEDTIRTQLDQLNFQTAVCGMSPVRNREHLKRLMTLVLLRRPQLDSVRQQRVAGGRNNIIYASSSRSSRQQLGSACSFG